MNRLFKAIVIYFAFVDVTFAQSELITFDNLQSNGPIPGNYEGFQWSSGFWYVNAVQFEENYGPNGYLNDLIEGTEVAFNAFGNPVSISSSGIFDLNSAYFTAAFGDDLQLEVQGFDGNTLIYNNSYILNETSPLLINFDYLGINNVDFTTYPNDGSAGNFAMANLVVTIPSTVPEPGVISLSIFGLIMIILGASLTCSHKSR